MRPNAQRLLLAHATMLACASVLVLASGFVRMRLSISLALVILLASIAAGVVFALRASPAPFGEPPEVAPIGRVRTLFWTLGGIATAAYAFLFVPLWSRPDISWDGMAYHLPAIQLWAQKGYVHWVGAGEPLDPMWRVSYVDPLINGYPKGAETLGFLLSPLTAGHLAGGWNFVLLPLGLLGIYVGARELGASRAVSFFAASLFALVPTNVAQATCGYVDTGYAACATAFFALVLIAMRRLLRGEPPSLALVVTAGELLGLALGIKPPAVALTVISVGVLVAIVVASARMIPRDTRRSFVMGAARRLSVLVVVASIVGGYWYVRNWAVKGNPLHPVEVKVGSVTVFPGVPLKEQITMDAVTPPFMKPWTTAHQVGYAWVQSGSLEWPPDVIVEHDAKGYSLALDQVDAVTKPAWPRAIRYQDSRSGGLGFSWLAASLPSALALGAMLALTYARTRKRSQLVELVAYAALLAIVAACFVSSPLRWWARYTLWLHAPGLIAFAVLLDRAMRKPLVRVAATVFASVLFGVCAFEYAYELKWSASLPYFVGPPQLHATANPRAIWRAVTETEDEGCGAIFHYMQPPLAREAMCSRAIVAVSPVDTGHDPTLGQLSSPPGARTLLFAPRDIGTDPAAAAAFVTKHLPRYVVWDPGLAGPAPVLEASATRWCWLYGLQIFEFGDAPPPTALLLPKP